MQNEEENDRDILIDHCFFKMKFLGVLLPKGYMVNRMVEHTREGATVIMSYDRTRHRIIKKLIIPLNAMITEAICFQLYNKPTSDLIRLWKGNYGEEISETECYFLILNKINDNDEDTEH